MKQPSPHTLGAILGYIAVSIGTIALGFWLLTDAENTITAVSAAATIIVGLLVITLSRRTDTSNTQ